MGFVEYKTAGCKIQVRDLLRMRLKLKDRVRLHEKKIQYHLDKIDAIKGETLISVEEQLNFYLAKAGNKV